MRRRALMAACKVGELPIGYKRLEYVESDGTNHIDTGVIGKSGLSCEGRMSFVVVPNDSTFIGSRRDSGDTRLYLLHYFQKPAYGYGKYYQCGTAAKANTIYDFATILKVGEQRFTWNGEVIGTNNLANELNTGYTMYIFALNQANVQKWTTKGRLYYLKIWENDVLVRDYIPCMNKEGVCGLWDKVNSTFNSSATNSPLIGA